MIKNNNKKKRSFSGSGAVSHGGRSFLGQHVFREKGAAIQVLVKDEEVGTYPLSEDQEITIGEGNILAISGGEAFMKWADCPDKLCIHQGKISHTGETIACLPNRVTVRVISGAASNVDSIAG
ncbi:MAG: NusG domain II-containing protein [Lachnospiraceae bacterium]